MIVHAESPPRGFGFSFFHKRFDDVILNKKAPEMHTNMHSRHQVIALRYHGHNT
ncbi:hypothetical protein FITA111629_05940 [Filibacter tadaridae]|uniref:Uncharacterized protein n=1 Tax=Filibacter tadaridae TaxID=2483811 RepID=A0A3P5WTL0_9BACL|nr:hypothetical protein FILTAD_00273 [Filibacter tadaridae]